MKKITKAKAIEVVNGRENLPNEGNNPVTIYTGAKLYKKVTGCIERYFIHGYAWDLHDENV